MTLPSTTSRLRQALDTGEFVVSVELATPPDADAAQLLAHAALVESLGVRFANVPDGPMARTRMGAIAASSLVERSTALEPIVHLTPRDRNLRALHGDLLGAHALGLRNLLAITGDAPSPDAGPAADRVGQLDSIAVLRSLGELDLGSDAGFCAGAVVDPHAADSRRELEPLRRKVDAGARFVISQPVYEHATLEALLHHVGDAGVPLIVGVLPLQGASHAEYLHHEVPGIEVPSALRRELRDAGDDGLLVGVDHAREFITQARGMVQGICLMPPPRSFEASVQALDVLDPSKRPAGAP
jgi:homocysteine S-methyltransferase